jgi:hypothetical protein
MTNRAAIHGQGGVVSTRKRVAICTFVSSPFNRIAKSAWHQPATSSISRIMRSAGCSVDSRLATPRCSRRFSSPNLYRRLNKCPIARK